MSPTRPSPARQVGPAAAVAPGLDLHLLLPTLLLVAFGVAMVFSASYPTVLESRQGDAYYFVKRQAMFAVVGGLLLWLASRVKLRLIRDHVYYFLAVSVLLLLVVLGIGREVNGSRSWLGLGSLRFQPSELAKVGLLLALAKLFADRPAAATTLKGLLLPLALTGFVCGLILLENDFGVAAVTGLAALILLGLAGARGKHLAALGVSGAILAGAFIAMKPTRLIRVISFLNPDAYADSFGYQINRSLIALGSGGPFGLGFSRSREKFFYLPTPHTDSIFAVIGEELGLVFCLGVLALFCWLGWRGLKVAAQSQDRFSALAAAGLTNLLLLQAAINLFVIVGLGPVTGIPLPFISYGGSSLVFSLIAVGLLANIARSAASPAGFTARLPDAQPGETESDQGKRYRLRPRGL